MRLKTFSDCVRNAGRAILDTAQLGLDIAPDRTKRLRRFFRENRLTLFCYRLYISRELEEST